MTIVLRPDQANVRDGVYNDWANGAQNVLAVKPTGGGKSIVISDIALTYDRQNGKQAIIAHRNELIGQLAGHMARRGIKHRIIAAQQTVSAITAEQRQEFGKSFVNPDANCAVVSVDTLLARASKLDYWLPQVGLWVTDEAHHCLRNNKWGKAASLFPNARGLGVTASPQRADGMGLGRHHDGIFDTMVLGPTMRQLINMGALCDYEIAIPEFDFHMDENDLTPSGDFSTKKMREESKRSHIVGGIVENYCKFAYGKRTIVFCTDVETANETAANFNAIGIRAASVSAKTPDHVRTEYIRRFRDGRLQVLVNVDLFGEGFDVPAVECVIMARPTASLAVYLQQFGRALRVMLGKLYGLIIDMVSNWKRHGFPDKHHFWSLDRREKRAKKEPDPELLDNLIGCRECSRPYEIIHRCCPYCGAMPPLPDPVNRTLEQVAGDLMLLDRSRLEQMRAAMILESPASMAERVAYAAGDIAGKSAANKQIERILTQQRLNDAIAIWAAHGRMRGRDDSELDRRFYGALNMSKYEALALPRADMLRLAEIVEGWQ